LDASLASTSTSVAVTTPRIASSVSLARTRLLQPANLWKTASLALLAGMLSLLAMTKSAIALLALSVNIQLW
jgi:hypothetical protein